MNAGLIYYATMLAAAAAPVGHRYYQLNISATGTSGNYCGIPELQLRTTVGGASVAVGGTASANSSYSGYPASNAFDGNTGTSWFSNGTSAPFILEYDFGSGNAHKIVQYAIYGQTTLGQTPSSWTLEYSDDGTTWTTADTRTSAAMTINAYNIFTVASP